MMKQEGLKMLLDQADGQIEALQIGQKEKDAIIDNQTLDNEQMGLELYRCYTSVDRMNLSLAQIKKELSDSVDSLKVSQVKQASNQSQIKQEIKAQKTLEETITKLNAKVADLTGSMTQLNDLNGLFMSTVKTYRVVEQKTTTELIARRKSQLDYETLIAKQKFAFDKLSKENLDTTQATLLIGKDNKKLQSIIDGLQREFSNLKDTNRNVSQQWEDAIEAMSKRDVVLQNSQESNAKLRQLLSESTMETQVLKSEFNKNLKTKVANEIENEGFVKLLMEARESIISFEEKERNSNRDLKNGARNEILNGQLINSLTKKLHSAIEHVDGKDQTVSNLKNMINVMKKTNDDANKSSLAKEMNDKIDKETKKVKDELNRELQKGSFKSDVLLNKFESMRYSYYALQNDMILCSNEKDVWQRKASSTKKDYDALHNEAIKILYLIEKKEKDMNLMRESLKKYGSNESKPQEIMLRRVMTENEALKKERDHFQQVWVDEHAEVLQYKETIKKQTELLESTNSRLYIGESVLKKDDTIANETKEIMTDLKIECAKYKFELERTQRNLAKTQIANTELESRCLESQMKVQEGIHNEKSKTEILKQEMRRLYQSQKDSRIQDTHHHGKSNISERKITLLKEMVEKLKKDRAQMANEAHVSRLKADASEKKFVDLKLEFMQFNNVVTRKGVNYQKNESSLPPLPSQLVSTPPITDFEAWRLRINSLTLEKQFLDSENKSLKMKFKSQQSKLDGLQHQLGQSTGKLVVMDQNRVASVEQHETMIAQLARAEKLAAHIEKQFKDWAPDVKIDYYRIGQVDPSVQLVSALMVLEK